MSIEETAFNLIRESKEGVFQNELWKMLEIDSRKCSRVVSKLLKEDLIVREQAVSNGARTYLLKVKEEEKPCFDLLLSGDMFSPCAGCRDACQPEICEKLTIWVANLNDTKETAEMR
ncbi:helix-turn-helix transcriptional regulator [Methanolobus bombayensis]|uniref:helix-turn-helix transcriptional regulator n=1 Tax=Methanolobus bombayensis TaxID=38023 RepID=UPI001AE57C73|nr:Lrp/AsnC family transcriptional regulator [Methanolobus bombayensis]MBP1910030.1 DNA-binding Lrp family transcriptional regulator [Methanolobus bombayensis]